MHLSQDVRTEVTINLVAITELMIQTVYNSDLLFLVGRAGLQPHLQRVGDVDGWPEQVSRLETSVRTGVHSPLSSYAPMAEEP